MEIFMITVAEALGELNRVAQDFMKDGQFAKARRVVVKMARVNDHIAANVQAVLAFSEVIEDEFEPQGNKLSLDVHLDS